MIELIFGILAGGVYFLAHAGRHQRRVRRRWEH